MLKKDGVTIYRIAKEANVSPATVSRVLTGSANVREPAKSRVLALINKYNFKPNVMAQSLYLKQSKMLGIILPDIDHPFYSMIVKELERQALEKGYTCLLCNSMQNFTIEQAYLDNLISRQVDGIVFLGGRINQTHPTEELRAGMIDALKHVPIVFVNGKMDGVDAHTIRTDEASGVRRLLELLTHHGHEAIGLLGGEIGVSSTDEKVSVFRETMLEKGLIFKEDWIHSSGYSIEAGEKDATHLIHLDHRPTAVLCMNDFVAIGAIKQFKKFGLKVPGDISVTGFDDTYLAEHFPPGVTSVNQNYQMLAKKTIETLIGLIAHEEQEKEAIVPTYVTVRNSCDEWQH
ncbi:LacI family DNA-binding transcriptional regulator [Shouchella lehensis]|uniref:Transcriptional regulator n=2 Tax=Shouchella lehensis TaxID=300825 RepID=A0A060M316_9BACI|nr:LacI family DNA-binding transcriptional regulator [Shouchella lehensis]AIC94469.1 transcriptional regulator [Shouchella lehensis G1]RQW20347.1 LacI family transcriptional regulator [Bacillus sp. C1-1]TES50360.1 LacI family transcriptional regulator [Shouchella lehensis]